MQGVMGKIHRTQFRSKDYRALQGVFRKTIIFFPGFESEQGMGCSRRRCPSGLPVLRGTGAQGRGGKRRGRRGGHPELLTLVRRRQRGLVDVVKGRSAAVQGDSSAPAAGGRWKRVEFGQLGILELVAGSAAPVGLHVGVSTSAVVAVGSGAAQVGPPAVLAQARGWLWGAHHPGALLL
jgi:hypothetical protein